MKLVGAAALVAIAATAIVFAAAGGGEAGVRAGIRVTARLSLLLFCVVFATSSLVALRPAPATRWLLRNRRHLGQSLATSQAVHGALIIWLATAWPEHFAVAGSTLAGGLLGYLFLLAMTITSFDGPTAWLGRKRWKLLHTAGMYWLFVVFATTYAGAAAAQPGYLLAVAPLVAALGLRGAARLRHHRRRRPG